MKQKKPYNLRLLLSFAAVFITGSILNEGLYEHIVYVQSHALLRYSIYFAILVLIYFMGMYGFKKQAAWVIAVWQLIYAGAVVLLAVSAVIDQFIFHYPDHIRQYIVYFRAIMISPVPFVIVYLLGKYVAVNSEQ